MAGAKSEWERQLEQAGIDAEITKAILGLGFQRSSSFANAFVDGGAFEAWLGRLKAKVPSAAAMAEDDWRTSPSCGDLRAFWKQLAQPIAVANSPPPRDRSPAEALALFCPAATPAKLDMGEREKLLQQFDVSYPGAALIPETTPSLPFLQTIKAQCDKKAWAWVPWKRILSDAALFELQLRRSSAPRKDLTEVLAEAAGLVGEEWDQDIAAAPLRVFQLLSTRAQCLWVVFWWGPSFELDGVHPAILAALFAPPWCGMASAVGPRS